MADGGVRIDHPPTRRPGITRRGLIKGTLAFLGFAAAAEAVRRIPEIPNGDQVKAARELDNPNTSKITLVVAESTDYEKGLKGPAIRTQPRISPSGDAPNAVGNIPAGEKLTGIYVEGVNPDTHKPAGNEWFAYRDPDGNVRFVSAKYLENPVPPNQPFQAQGR